MKSIFTLLIAVALAALCGVDAGAAEPGIPIPGASAEIAPPAGWIQIPEKAMGRFQQSTPGFKSNYVAGFAGPRPPANTPMTLLLVQVLPASISPKNYIDSSEAAFAYAKAAQPHLALEREGFRVVMDGKAVICGIHGRDERVGRTYAFPTSTGILEFSLFCPAKDAATTIEAVNSSLQKIKLTDGASFRTEWIDELKKSLTKQCSQDDCLSHFVLAHELRQATVWLTFHVRQRKANFEPTRISSPGRPSGIASNTKSSYNFAIRTDRVVLNRKFKIDRKHESPLNHCE